MAKLEVHVETDRYAVAFGPLNAEGAPLFTTRLFSFRDSVEECAAKLLRRGEGDVFILETVTTWKGKNGKRTTTEVSRTRVTADGLVPEPVVPGPVNW